MTMQRTVATSVAALLIACLTATAAADDTATEPAAAAPKVVLLPTYFQIYSLATASAQEAPEWSRAAERDATAAVHKLLPDHGDLQLQPMPELSAEEQELVKQQLAFYRVVAQTAQTWARTTKGEYSIGPQLAFLRAKTGADKAVIIHGQDIISTGGRMAFTFIAAAAGIGIVGGSNFITAGMIDLETGRIEWATTRGGMGDLTDQDNILESLDKIICAYPGASTIGPEITRDKCGRKFQDGEVFYTPEQRRAMKEKERRMKRKQGG